MGCSRGRWSSGLFGSCQRLNEMFCGVMCSEIAAVDRVAANELACILSPPISALAIRLAAVEPNMSEVVPMTRIGTALWRALPH